MNDRTQQGSRGAEEQRNWGRTTTHYSLLTTHSHLPIIEWRRQRLPLAIFLVLCINVLIAPAVYAAAGGGLERKSAYAIALLGLVTLGLVVYLFVVVFQPERF
ncbi:MAG TPA: K(+)-transporting ATPase subunit F [Cyanobacteria bacterium UBA11049]|nr:K(+)-transporting ATPase subunit F [Cyanobacteria bacterium UBA11049]